MWPACTRGDLMVVKCCGNARVRTYIFNAVPNDHVAPRARWPKDLISHLLIALGLDFGQRCAAPDQIDGDTEAFPLLQCRVCFAEAVCVSMCKRWGRGLSLCLERVMYARWWLWRRAYSLI